MSNDAKNLLEKLNIDYQKVVELKDDSYLIEVEEIISNELQKNIDNKDVLKVCEEIMDYLAS